MLPIGKVMNPPPPDAHTLPVGQRVRVASTVPTSVGSSVEFHGPPTQPPPIRRTLPSSNKEEDNDEPHVPVAVGSRVDWSASGGTNTTQADIDADLVDAFDDDDGDDVGLDYLPASFLDDSVATASTNDGTVPSPSSGQHWRGSRNPVPPPRTVRRKPHAHPATPAGCGTGDVPGHAPPVVRTTRRQAPMRDPGNVVQDIGHGLINRDRGDAGAHADSDGGGGGDENKADSHVLHPGLPANDTTTNNVEVGGLGDDVPGEPTSDDDTTTVHARTGNPVLDAAHDAADADPDGSTLAATLAMNAAVEQFGDQLGAEAASAAANLDAIQNRLHNIVTGNTPEARARKAERDRRRAERHAARLARRTELAAWRAERRAARAMGRRLPPRPRRREVDGSDAEQYGTDSDEASDWASEDSGVQCGAGGDLDMERVGVGVATLQMGGGVQPSCVGDGNEDGAADSTQGRPRVAGSSVSFV